jgi:branched-chain amino acid transport system ATP-binding protein
LTASLRVRDLRAGYGSSTVLRNVTLEVAAGSVVCVMGRNGAGKTTLLRALMGVIPKQGRVELDGRDITDWSSHRINRAGMVWVPQDDSVFAGLTVREHLAIAVHNDDVAAGAAAAVSLFAALGTRLDQEAQTLSGGERKMLAIAQALIARPRVILLDEPTEGVAPVVVEKLLPAIRLAAERAAVILVEQNLDTALDIGRTAYVLEHGRVVESGDIAALHASGVLEERLAL